jgi:hypothetical protein
MYILKQWTEEVQEVFKNLNVTQYLQNCVRNAGLFYPTLFVNYTKLKLACRLEYVILKFLKGFCFTIFLIRYFIKFYHLSNKLNDVR